MLPMFQVVTLALVALAMACSVGHALELPGKMRLSKDTYLAVQPIYYPGFTVVGGGAEILGMLATLALSLATPRTSPAFALTLAAFAAMAIMHVVFWLVTQPVNKFLLQDRMPEGKAATFLR